jgi:hypothetical protein
MVAIVWAKEIEGLGRGVVEGEAAANAERDARVACDMGKRADRCLLYSFSCAMRLDRRRESGGRCTIS